MYKMFTTSLATLAAFASIALAQELTTVTVTVTQTVANAQTTYTTAVASTYTTSMLYFLDGYGYLILGVVF